LSARYEQSLNTIESLTLDKEEAEERTESSQLELETLREQLEEAKLNLEVYEEERDLKTAGQASDVDLDSMTRQNLKLKEALLK